MPHAPQDVAGYLPGPKSGKVVPQGPCPEWPMALDGHIPLANKDLSQQRLLEGLPVISGRAQRQGPLAFPLRFNRPGP